jgi:hypothetical protein
MNRPPRSFRRRYSRAKRKRAPSARCADPFRAEQYPGSMPLYSAGEVAAVDGELATGNVDGVVRGEEGNR